jgi:Tol biopolymer transport system component
MGEVWRARDTRLGREVAVKVLPAEVAGDAARLLRFEQEARAASALSHPNILTLFDVGRENGTSFLVTELLEGESLRARLGDGPMPPRTVVGIGVEIARGLAAAHARGIVHRDIKPENLFLSREGGLKILDFGLAKLAPREAPLSEATTAAELTATGAVLGTVGYMAPEQVRGEGADARSDLFALGCVLYELAAGRRAFSGRSAPETLSAILRDEPAPLAAPGPTGTVLEGIVRRCLEKRPDDRFQSAHDLGFALEALLAPTAPVAPVAAPGAAAGRTPLRTAARWAGLAALVAGGVGVGVLLRPRPAAPPASGFGSGSLVQLTTDPGYEAEPTFSPDGQTIAYVADRDGNFEIYLQQISGGPAINLTRNPAADVQPAFSPDGREIAFVSTRTSASGLMHAAARLPRVGGDIWVMPALGGTPRRIVEGGNFPSWSPDGSALVYVHGTFHNVHLAVVPAAGGPSRDLPIEEHAGRYFFPRFSADGRWILYQHGGQVEVVAAGGGRPKVLAAGSYPAWGPGSASVLFSNGTPGKERTVWQAPFDPARGDFAGPATPVTFGRGADLGAQASRDGGAIVFAVADEQLNLEELPFDTELGQPTGAPRELTRGSQRISTFDASRDGRSFAYAVDLGAGPHIWRLDPPGPPVQLTFDAAGEVAPKWSPDGRTIAFQRNPPASGEGEPELWQMGADGGAPHRLSAGIGTAAWLADGRRMVVQRGEQLALLDVASGAETPISGAKTRTLFTVDAQEHWIVMQSSDRGNVDLVAVPLAGGAPRTVVATPREDYHPMLSSSGRWLYFLPDHANFARVPGPAQGWRSATPEPVTHFTDNDLFLEDPHLAHDGTRLYYLRGRTTADLWVLRLDRGPAGRNPVGATAATATPGWLPATPVSQ